MNMQYSEAGHLVSVLQLHEACTEESSIIKFLELLLYMGSKSTLIYLKILAKDLG